MDAEYRKEVATGAPAESVLTAALQVLLPIGFALEKRDTMSATFSAPRMHSSNQNHLIGASTIHVRAGGGYVRVEATLGGVRRMMRGMAMLVLLLAGAMMAGFGYFMGGGALRTVGLSFAPWLLLLPLLSVVFASRTRRALDTFAKNIVALADNG